MYLINKYYSIYYSIINRGLSRTISGYIEKHHIIPKSMGGSDDATNIVHLTAREHFICHLLLVKMTTGKDQFRMACAARMMSTKQDNRITARHYETLKKMSRRTAQDFTFEWKEKIRKSKLGKTTWNKGIPRTQAVKDAVSRATKGRTAWNKGISRHWVNNGTMNKLVYPQDLLSCLNKGWVQGRYAS